MKQKIRIKRGRERSSKINKQTYVGMRFFRVRHFESSLCFILPMPKLLFTSEFHYPSLGLHRKKEFHLDSENLKKIPSK
jgi:hypothetical protein